jgi:hypothetical protein
MSAITVARTRLAILGRQIHHTLSLSDTILFQTTNACTEISPHENWGYAIQMDVSHDNRLIHFVTESMTASEKRNVYLRQKRMIREMYPEYMITERHT